MTKELEMSIDEILAPSNDCRLLSPQGNATEKAPASEQSDCHQRLAEAEKENQVLRWQQGFLNEDF